MAEIVVAYDGPVAVKSFDPQHRGGPARRWRPGIPRGIVAETRQDDPAYATLPPSLRRSLSDLLHFDETRPDFLSWRVDDLPCAPTVLCRLLGRRPVMTWTVRNPDQRRLAEAACRPDGVRGVPAVGAAARAPLRRCCGAAAGPWPAGPPGTRCPAMGIPATTAVRPSACPLPATGQIAGMETRRSGRDRDGTAGARGAGARPGSRLREWDACATSAETLAGGDETHNPFVSHAFLSSLEDSGCVSRRTGWLPLHVAVEREGRLVGRGALLPEVP